MSEAEIALELKTVHAAHPALADRIDAVSERFLGVPYKLGPMGEGDGGDFERKPLYSFRELDCTTFVEETMALSLEPDLGKAKALLQRIRYKEGNVSYETRNHFPETDWIPNNAAAGFIEDITARVAGGSARWVKKAISKREWYAQKCSADLAGFPNEPPSVTAARVARWRATGAKIPDEEARLPYLPAESLPALAASIPSGTIGNVIREARDDKPIVVTHQLLILQRPGGPIIRHAAFGKQVMDVGLLEYFARLKDAKWRVLGLNLNGIRQRP